MIFGIHFARQTLYVTIVTLISYLFAARSQTYSLEGSTSSVYTWGASYPQSCKCAENGATSSTCSYFKCSCVCDISAGSCDYGCCCDPDCSSDQISRFESLDVCVKDGTESDRSLFCYSSTDLAKINPRPPLTGETAASRGVGEALCVYKKNSFAKELYYSNTDLQSTSIFTTSKGEKNFDYIESNPVATIRDSYYDQNDTITAYYDISGDGTNLVSYGSGFWQIPVRDSSGYCNDFNLVKFEKDIGASSDDSCIRLVPSLSSDFNAFCQGLWSLDYYVSRLRVARLSSTVAATTTNVQNVSISLVSLYHQDYTTGDISSVDISSFNISSCGTAVVSSGSSEDFDKCGYALSETLLNIIGNSTSTCRSAIQSVSYKVIHDASAAASISSIEASVTLVDIPYSTSSESQFQQSFQVIFTSESASSISEANGNIVNRERSGNPGYLIGRPLIFGNGYFNSSISSTTPQYILEYVEGLTIPTPFTAYDINNPESFGLSLCPKSSQISYINKNPIKFGYDVTTGCILHLNYSELNDICCQGASCGTTSVSPYSDPSSGVPYFFNFTSGYIGIFGNADPLDVSQWFEVTQTISSATRSWTESTATCSNMFTGMNFEFLIAKTGERSAPQNKIVAASVAVTSSNWVYRYPKASQSLKQTFPLTITATFVYTNAQDLQGYTPPSPPVLFRVPYDVFYPFQTSGASSRFGAITGIGLLALLITIYISL